MQIHTKCHKKTDTSQKLLSISSVSETPILSERKGVHNERPDRPDHGHATIELAATSSATDLLLG